MVQRSPSLDANRPGVRDNVATLAQHEAFARIRERHIGAHTDGTGTLSDATQSAEQLAGLAN
jgi:hypothetical protein